MTQLKLIVAGGRDFNNYALLSEQIEGLATGLYQDYAVSIVSGTARGADALGARFANEHNVVLHEFPADWGKYGKAAGFIRNREMADFSDVLLAFWDGESHGTAHMIQTMRLQGKPVHVVMY